MAPNAVAPDRQDGCPGGDRRRWPTPSDLLEDPALDPTLRLRLASHIHYALLRHYGVDVPVGTLLRGGEAAREALWVCEASEHAGLPELARRLGGLQAEDAAARRAAMGAPRDTAAAPQDVPWAGDTSGFGFSRPADDEVAAAAPRRTGWFAATVGRGRRSGPGPGR